MMSMAPPSPRRPPRARRRGAGGRVRGAPRPGRAVRRGRRPARGRRPPRSRDLSWPSSPCRPSGPADPALAIQTVAAGEGNGVGTGGDRPVTVGLRQLVHPAAPSRTGCRWSGAARAGPQTRASLVSSDGSPSGVVETSTDGRTWEDGGSTTATFTDDAVAVDAALGDAADGTGLWVQAQLGRDVARLVTTPGLLPRRAHRSHDRRRVAGDARGGAPPSQPAPTRARPRPRHPGGVRDRGPHPHGRQPGADRDRSGRGADEGRRPGRDHRRRRGHVHARLHPVGDGLGRGADRPHDRHHPRAERIHRPARGPHRRAVRGWSRVWPPPRRRPRRRSRSPWTWRGSAKALDVPSMPTARGLGLRRKVTLADGSVVVGLPVTATVGWFQTAAVPTEAPPGTLALEVAASDATAATVERRHRAGGGGGRGGRSGGRGAGVHGAPPPPGGDGAGRAVRRVRARAGARR